MPYFELKKKPESYEEFKEFEKISIEATLLYWINGMENKISMNSFFHNEREIKKFRQEIRFLGENAVTEDNTNTSTVILEFRKWDRMKFNLLPFSPILLGVWADRKEEVNFKGLVDEILEEFPKRIPNSITEHMDIELKIPQLLKKKGEDIRKYILEKWNNALQLVGNNDLELLHYYMHAHSYFEHLKYTYGLLLACFDILEGCFDNNLLTYFNEYHYPNRGMYSGTRAIFDAVKGVLVNQKKKVSNKKKTLKQYVDDKFFRTVELILSRIMNNIELRNMVAHRLLSVDIKTLNKDNTAKLQIDLFTFLGIIPSIIAGWL